MLIAGNWKMNLKYEDIINFKNIISDFKLDNFDPKLHIFEPRPPAPPMHASQVDLGL